MDREYHYIILQSWEVKKTRPLEDMVGSTWNYEANADWVQIALVWNFNTYPPTKSQIAALKQLIRDIEAKVGKLILKKHNDVGITACPGKFFEIQKYDLWQYEWKWDKVIFSLSRYYSPMVGQKSYYLWKTYEQDKVMNCWPWNCLVTANWHKLCDEDMYKTVACDRKYLGKKFYLEWVGIVTCNDVGSAITANRLDMRCWIWDKALQNRNKCPTGQRIGYLVK